MMHCSSSLLVSVHFFKLVSIMDATSGMTVALLLGFFCGLTSFLINGQLNFSILLRGRLCFFSLPTMLSGISVSPQKYSACRVKHQHLFHF